MKPFISISSGAFNGYALEVAFEEVAKIGASHLELIFIHGFSDPFDEHYFNTDNAQMIRKHYADSGLQCHTFASHMDLSQPANVGVFIQRMDFAKAIGADTIITYTGPLDRKAYFLNHLDVLIKHAEALDLTIALENPGDGKRSIVDAGVSAAALIQSIGSNQVKCNYDFGNLMSHFREDIRPEDDFQTVLNNTTHFHIKDTQRTETGWTYPAIGQGDIDYNYIFKTLERYHCSLPMCLEIPMSMTRDVYGIPKMAKTPLPLETIREMLIQSLQYVRQLSNID